MTSRQKKIILRTAILIAVAGFSVFVAGIYYVHRHIPAELLPDLRAAIAARGEVGAEDRFNTYMEKRYGSMDNPANRERAFEDFFNPNHIRAMQIIVKYSPPGQRLSNIQASADWIEKYRQNMSPQEKSDLQNYFESGPGARDLQTATAQFMSQDAEYRSTVVPVITELMTTLATVKSEIKP